MILTTSKAVFTFTRIDNRILRNPKLSLEAKGMICYMLSFPETWTFSKYAIMKDTNITEYAFNKIMKELKENGYVYSKIAFNPALNKNLTEYNVCESPNLDDIFNKF